MTQTHVVQGLCQTRSQKQRAPATKPDGRAGPPVIKAGLIVGIPPLLRESARNN